jgi:hypothetical protein
MRRKLADLEEGRTGIEQRAHALARQELAARGVLRARLPGAARRGLRHLLAQVGNQFLHARGVGAELFRPGVQARLDHRHQPLPRARPMTRRWMSLAPS